MTGLISKAATRLAVLLASAAGTQSIGHGTRTVKQELDSLSPTVPGRVKSLSEVMVQTVPGGQLTIACYGDSLTFGQDTVSTTGDLQPGINGSTNTRALYQYPEALGSALTRYGFHVTVTNYGFPGDTSTDGLGRWPAQPAVNVAFIMYGTNDAKDNGGVPLIAPATYKANIGAMIEREQGKGAYVVLLTPPRLHDGNLDDGVNLPRQRYLRIFESILVQLGQQYAVPVVSVDELVSHRGADVYSDSIHFNKWGYNEWGWNLSALIAQGGIQAKRIGHGTVLHAAGSSMTGLQTVIGSTVVLKVGGVVRACVSGYFEESVVARVYFRYNAVEGGTQAAKIVLAGGTRNASIAETRAMQMAAGPYRIVNTDVIRKGFRTFFVEPAVAGNAYVEKIEFVRPHSIVTDTVNEYGQISALRALNLPAAADANRWVVDEGMRMDGDFTIEADLTAAPVVGEAAGLSLVAEFNGDTVLPDCFINVTRFENAGQAFVRVAHNASTGTFDDTFYAAAFAGAATVIKVVRTGNDFAIYANGALLVTKTLAVGRILPAVFRTNAAVTVNKLVAR